MKVNQEVRNLKRIMIQYNPSKISTFHFIAFDTGLT